MESRDAQGFTYKGALVVFVGMDTPTFKSGDFEAKFRYVSKRGSAILPRTVFPICRMSLCCANAETPIFCFMNKKESKGNILRLHGCRRCKVFAHLLCTGEAVCEPDGRRIVILISKLNRHSLE